MPSLLTSAAAGTAAVLGLGGLAYAALHPESQIFGKTLIAGRDPDELALTFDDGPNPSATPALLEVLARYGVRATFFLLGNYVRQQPQLAREVAAAGHLVGNHTFTHPRLVWRTRERVRQELEDASSAIEDAIGSKVGYFRPPHGARRPDVIQAARELGMTTVQWNVTAHDWSPIRPEGILRRVQIGVARNRRLSRGSNILLHDGAQWGLNAVRSDTVAATRLLLEQRMAEQRFVTVDAWG